MTKLPARPAPLPTAYMPRRASAVCAIRNRPPSRSAPSQGSAAASEAVLLALCEQVRQHDAEAKDHEAEPAAAWDAAVLQLSASRATTLVGLQAKAQLLAEVLPGGDDTAALSQAAGAPTTSSVRPPRRPPLSPEEELVLSLLSDVLAFG